MGFPMVLDEDEYSQVMLSEEEQQQLKELDEQELVSVQ